VALVDGPVSSPFGRFPADARAELVYVDWRMVAERLVTDLIRRESASEGSAIVFEAEARMRAALADYAQSI